MFFTLIIKHIYSHPKSLAAQFSVRYVGQVNEVTDLYRKKKDRDSKRWSKSLVKQRKKGAAELNLVAHHL